ncbi:MAG TPA: MFS transporter, partial [Thermomicrobiales bacterium]
WVCLLAAAPMLAVFAAFERRLSSRGGTPLLDLRLFRDRTFVLGLALILILYAANAGYFLTLALYLQIGLGFTALHAGLTFTPDAVGFFIAATLSARLLPKLGSRLLLIGVLLRALGLTILIITAHQLGENATSFALIPGVFLQGLGSGSVSAPLVGFILGGIRGGDAGAAAGVLTTIQQIAGAIGVAIIGLVFFGSLAQGATGIAGRLTPTLGRDLAATALPTTLRENLLLDFQACVQDRARERDPAIAPPSCAQPTLNPADPAASTAVKAALSAANARSYAGAFVISVGCAIVGLLIAGLLMLQLPKRQLTPLD